MSEFNNQHTPPEEYLTPPEFDQTHWDNATYGMYEDPSFGYTADVPTDLQPILMEDLFTPQLSPFDIDEHPTSWLPVSDFGDSPESYFSFQSSSLTSSPVDTPASFSTLSSGGQIPQTPSSPVDTLASLSPLSSGGQKIGRAHV